MRTLLKNAREEKGIKTRELAQLLGIDQALISKFESGSRTVSYTHLVQEGFLDKTNAAIQAVVAVATEEPPT